MGKQQKLKKKADCLVSEISLRNNVIYLQKYVEKKQSESWILIEI